MAGMGLGREKMKAWRKKRGFISLDSKGNKIRVTAKIQHRLPVEVVDALRATAKEMKKAAL